MADTDAEVALTRAHQTIRDGAAVSKRSIAAHRRALREQNAALEEIEKVASRLGMRLHINDQGQRRPKS